MTRDARVEDGSRVSRRRFGAGVAGAALGGLARRARGADDDAEAIRRAIDAHRPARGAAGFAGWPDRLGAAHVAGAYHLTGEPFLVEGARRLLALGTRAAKFWFQPHGVARDYRWNHAWPTCPDFVALAQTEPFRAAFALPFRVVALECLMPHDGAWRGAGDARLEAVTGAIEALADHLLATYRDREVTFLLQNWEGDWALRGAFVEDWRPAPAEAERLCARMAAWLAARQRGVERARDRHPGARCRVLHSAEVNRVRDLERGIPTMTADVLPRVEVDLVSYSCYDALDAPEGLYRAIGTLRRHACTGPALGPGAVMLGEIGLPENERDAAQVPALWDGWLGAALAQEVRYVFAWQLYCNERRPGAPPPEEPVRDPAHCRGFWLVRPDGSLSHTGRMLTGLWKRANA